MNEFSIPYEFVAGTKAKAEEVNSNFNALKNELAQKASKSGSPTTQLSVANATEAEHAVNKSQLDEISSKLTTEIKGKSTLFCVKSGNTTDGDGDLFEFTNLIITPKVADGINGNHKPLTIINIKGELSTRTSLNQISMSGKEDGTYNIFAPIEGDAYVLKNTIYYEPTTPTMLENDIWLNMSVEPLSALKFNGSEKVEFKDVPLGYVTIKTGAITELSTNPYNQNKYDVNSLSKDWTKIIPDYKRVIGLSTTALFYAPKCGWMYISGQTVSDGYISLYIDGIEARASSNPYGHIGRNSSLILINKGSKANLSRGGDNSVYKYSFIPCIGN